ncbi:AraC family ligand binding domain-containing protein [Dongia deserti]|uniref:AraC family ligand binding domain-containing protein n=1 Tax=Dongia deserti TaxID=2268030 RepID=UPI0013C4154A|nr:AraC family ligand binding domain-containing protein [Dongia deserti]
MADVMHFLFDRMPFIPCKVPGGETRIARVVNGQISRHMGGGLEIGENVRYDWTTLYDEILFIHEGSMIMRTDRRAFECRAGDIVWLPEGATVHYDMTGRRCSYFYALYPFDWAERHGMAEP